MVTGAGGGQRITARARELAKNANSVELKHVGENTA
jgi:hypothetical protein